jgi:hypothetical protein
LPGPRAARGSAVVNHQTWKKRAVIMQPMANRTLG